MEDIDSSPTSPNPRKRAAPDDNTPGKKPLNLKGTQFVMPTPPDMEESGNVSPTSSGEQQREGSPALSISTMTSVEIVGSTQADGTNNAATPASTSTKPRPAKRRKLTPSEKLERARDKEIKEQEKAGLRARKDEEKRAKDEEKRAKAEEREAKKREKELEEQRKGEAKLKKERSQMRLAAFFGAKPATPSKSPAAQSAQESSVSARRKSLSLEPFDAVADQIRRSASPTKGATRQLPTQAKASPMPTKPVISDYRKHFLPFELPSHSTLARSFNITNPDDLAYWQGEFDRELKDPSFREKVDLGLVEPAAVVEHMFQGERKAERGMPQPNMRALVDRIQGTSNQPIDLTQEGPVQQPLEAAMQQVTRRYLHFEEDVRPAYFGTYTKIRSSRSTRRLMLDPFSRTRKDTDYDDDSEAEWEEPEEGDDDVGDEEEEAESQGDADEMDGFLDDEDDASKNKRKMITGDLHPACTGMYWENDANIIVQSTEGEDEDVVQGIPKEMRGMRLGVLLPYLSGQTIDPFSTAYWAHEMAPPAVPVSDAPSRPPLQERHSNGSLTQSSLLGASQGEKGPITNVAASQGAKRGPKPQPKTLSKENLDEFKEAVIGSPLGKLELCKGLKARFPKMTNETIKDTLSTHFAHMGAKGNKKWAFVVSVSAE